MASSSKPKRLYDVFLSFRGTDVRNNFLGHLYKALKQNGIYTFIDSEELRKGDRISPELMKAIEESCITIIIFSKDYASSRWCLEELAKIMKCKEQKDLTVLPVFYKVDPRDVRGCRESYASALDTHASNFGKDSKEVQTWKKALSDAGSLSGWHLNDGDESEVIQSIVKEISTRLDRTVLHVAKHPVGIVSRVAKLKSMLNLESNNDVVVVGLWGQGGIGKTTLVKALYNSIFRQFEGSCFLANVRGNSEGDNGLAALQETLLNDILLPRQRFKVPNKDRGITFIQQRLNHKKVLIILDDVDDLRQVDALAGENNWFGNGSTIVVATRDKQVLNCRKIDQDHVYEVELLDRSEALELLRRHAFRTPRQSKIKLDLVNAVVNYAKGLPLALEVLGSFLHDKRENVWESTLKKLSRFPKKEINNVLKISYDGLQEDEQEIFLYIVCFFKGKDSEYVKKVLDNCDLAATAGLEVLKDRSLISIKEYGVVHVHDLIQMMGIHIVNQEKDLGRRSKLWMYDDVNNVLQRDMGDCAIEAIVLELPKPREMYFDHYAFKRMRKLKLLIMCNVHNSFRGPIYLPNELSWIELTECNWRPEFSSSRKKPAGFGMGNGSITRMVKQFETVCGERIKILESAYGIIQEFRKMKFIKLDRCDSLVSTPDVSCTPNLEELHLEHCQRLVEAHRSIVDHDKLQVLEFSRCVKFRDFPKELKSKNLRELKLIDCPKFKRFPDIPFKLRRLRNLELINTSIKKIPTSIENLVFLKEMRLTNRKNTVSLPCTIYNLLELRQLRIHDTAIRFPKQQISANSCMKIGLPFLTDLALPRCQLSEVEFLGDLSCFPVLKALSLTGNNITSLPMSISKRDNLSLLRLGGCRQLQEIPDLPPFLEELTVRDCESLKTDLTSIDPWVRLASLAQNSHRLFILPKGDMPEWFPQMEEGFVSFMASKDLYDKFLGLIFCVVHNGKASPNLRWTARFEGITWVASIGSKFIFASQRTVAYVPPSFLWKVVDFGQTNGSYAQFSLKLEGKDVKKYGLQIICKQLEDHLKIEIQDNQLIDISLLHEVGNISTNLEAESSHTYKDSPVKAAQLENLQDYQMSIEKHCEIREEDHEFSSLEACKPRLGRLLIRLTEVSLAMFGRCFCCRE